jgi:ribose transport system permease protein
VSNSFQSLIAVLSKRLNARILGVLTALVATFVIFAVLEPMFLTWEIMLEIGVQSTIIAFVAIGLTFVIITGGIDISVGSIVGLTAVICATNLDNWGTGLTIIAAIAIGAGLGAFNGAVSAIFNLQSFVVTLATLNLFRGLAFLYTQGRPIYNLDTGFREFFSAELGPIPKPILYIIGFTFISYLILNRTRMGLHFKAIGTNADASLRSGVNVKKSQILAFTLGGAFCGIATLMLMSRIGAAEPISGTGFELQAIAAVVVGGTSLMGGRGSIVGTVLGAILLGSIAVGLTLLNVNAFVQLVVTGVIVLGAVLTDRFATRSKVGRS